MKVASDFSRPALTSLYEVAGRFVSISFADQATHWSITNFLDRWHVSLVKDSALVSQHATLIFAVESLPAVPDGFEEFDIGGGNVGYATDTAHLILFPDRAIIAADETEIVRIWLTEPLKHADNLLPQLISHALSAALRRCGVFELHSGAVVSDSRSRSVLICGPSGSGKSTLTLQLAAAGWNYLSDDAVLLGIDAGMVKASGVRRFFALTRQTIEESGLTALHENFPKSPPDSHQKLSVVPEAFFPSGLIEECTPNTLLFPIITEQPESRARELSLAETMSRLIRLCPWSCYDQAVARGFLDVLARLVKQSDSFELSAGADLLGDPSFTSSFLAKTFAKQK